MAVLIVSALLRGVYAETGGPVELASPNGTVTARISVNDSGALQYSLSRSGVVVLDACRMGITVDGRALGNKVSLGRAERRTVNETYPWRGVKSQAVNHYNEADLTVIDETTHSEWTVQARAYDDGFAFRYVIPGNGTRKVTAEATDWRLPAGSTVWYNHNTVFYESNFLKRRVEEIPLTHAESTREARRGTDVYLAFPATIVLPDGSYAAVTEANVMGYSGMTLRPTGTPVFKGVFEDDPKGWEMNGEIKSPWRITMTGPDLNALVNCDIIHNVCPPPDKTLFPDGIQTDWIRPGHALWQWWGYGRPGTEWSKQKWFIDKAAELKLEYYLVDEGWEDPAQGWFGKGNAEGPWAKLKELCDYARTKQVGVWVWRAWKRRGNRPWPGLDTPAKRIAFFRNCAEAGVVGLKIDFMNSESHDMLQFYEDCLRLGVKHKIMINFHGANKPAGESRTWPNELTREAIKAMELNRGQHGQVPLTSDHYAAAPFVRFLAGHGDFTPLTVQKKRMNDTTLGLQMASSVVLTSPFITWADKPDLYEKSKVADFLGTVPTTWDQTIVLPGSDIGKLAAFARRKGSTWYVAIVNGEECDKDYTLTLSFLEDGDYSAHTYEDTMADSADVKTSRFVVHKNGTIKIKMKAGGGYVGIFSR